MTDRLNSALTWHLVFAAWPLAAVSTLGSLFMDYAAPLMVVIVTTLGMLIADAPAVFVGDKLANKIPMKLVHSIAAV